MLKFKNGGYLGMSLDLVGAGDAAQVQFVNA
jgi:hypothetical protein